MLQAFIDDSKSEQDPPFYVLGGYVAHAETWTRFAEEWRRSLEMRPRIRYFKYSEAVRGEGEFNGMSDEARIHRIKTMRRLIEQFDLIEFGVGFRIGDHNDAFKLLRPEPNPNYYVFASSRVITIIVKGLEAHGVEDDHLKVTFDDQVMDKALVLEAWQNATKLVVANNPTPLVSSLLQNTPHWADDHHVLPLQAADLHATWLRIDAENQLQGRQREPVPGFSKALRGISKVYHRPDLFQEFQASREAIIRLRTEGRLWPPSGSA
jgi:hypothetical protein